MIKTDSSWVSLRTHSQYSILDSLTSTKAIAKKSAEYGMPAVALTDHGNLFGAVEFYKACKAEGVKPIIGCDMYVAPRSRTEKKRESKGRTSYSTVFLAKNDNGYHNLCKLSSIGYLEGFYYFPRIDRESLEKHGEGLICIEGGLASRLAFEILEGTEESVKEHIKWYKTLFGEDYYFELQFHPMSEEDRNNDGMYQESWLIQQYQDYVGKQEKVNQAIISLGKEYSVPIVATNDSHYMNRADWQPHEVLLNVQSGEPVEIWEKDSQGNPKFRVANPKRKTYPSHEFYFKSPQQMEQLFKETPVALANTLLIAEKCNVEIDFVNKHYPIYEPPSLQGRSYSDEERAQAVEVYLRHLCEEGIPKRYNSERLAKVQELFPNKEPMQVVRERLEYEMSIIAPKGMCDYLLIVWDFINWAKNEGIPVGPGRGSGAGSIVLYLIGITDIEPLRFHLFFERFINPERLSYPDIDVDICMDKRGEVINYTLNKYGKDNVAQIITFGTMKAKMAIKDVGRVLSVPLAKVNEIAKLIPDDLGITIDLALEKDPELRSTYENDEEAHRVIDIARILEGSIRNTGIHAAGIIISGEPLTEFIPLCNAKDSEMPVTQFSMKPVESVGMLKVDFLGLKTLTAIQTCVDAIAEKTGNRMDWVDLPLDNEAAFNLLNQGKTLGVFQLESGGMQDLAKQLHLDKFEEIIAVAALYRPGPMDMIPSFINRKHGREPIEYDHEWMQDILAETYGIMVYQEQVMQIAQKLANYSLGEGDVLRRAMGKKDHAQMEKEREKFRQGAMDNGISDETATLIFDKMEKFASYGFNKSHAAAYGYVSYVTAYLKSNYPKEWMAALLTCDSDDITKVAKFITECQAMDIKMLPPDVNEAGQNFVASKEGIRFAMSGIKGVGTGVVEAIIKERERNGPFENFYQFFKRIDKKAVGKKVVENLVFAGCFDFTGWSRDQLLESIEVMYDAAVKEQKEEAAGVMTLFSLMGETEESRFSKPPEVKHNTSKQDILLKEKELLGFFLTGHPMDAFKDVLLRLSCVPLKKVPEMDNDSVFRTAVIVEVVNTRLSQKSGKKFAILVVSDGMARYELPVWADMYEEKSHLLLENQLLYTVIHLERQDGNERLSCKWLDDLNRADEQMICECDNAFDRAKMFIARAQRAKAAGKDKKEKKEEPKPKKKDKSLLSVTLDANNSRLSHILQIKEVIHENRGSIPLKLDFLVEKTPIATLHIDSQWGINRYDEVAKLIKKIPSVIDAE
ncbi:MAG: DNA polymerase III subunit alpha [Chlamydiota bacterium]